MYKYIIYCSISAVIILLSKYIYQNWLKIKHTIFDIKTQLFNVQNKVSILESEIEKKTISGGSKIPIVFRPIEKKSPKKSVSIIENSNYTENSSVDNYSSSSENTNVSFSNNNVNDNNSNHMKKDNDSNDSKNSNSTNNTNHTIKDNDSNDSSNNDINKDNNNVNDKSNSNIIDVENDEEISLESIKEKSEEIKIIKKTNKKKLPDPKTYNNGDKYLDDGVEYICVVGKRGGHSWKKI